MRETRVWALGGEDPLEKETATHSSILAWTIPWTEEPGRQQSMGSQRVGHNCVTSLSFTMSWPRQISWRKLGIKGSFLGGALAKNLPVSAGDSGDSGLILGSGRSPGVGSTWQWQPAPVFLPGEFHGQRSLVDCNPWGHRVGHDWATEHSTHTHGY